MSIAVPTREVTYSYAAGSTSLAPHGYRTIVPGEASRLNQLTETFPSLRRWIHDQTMVISAYPASLSLTGAGPFVDTYLHPPTFTRACLLASEQSRMAIFASQPLAGAELINQHAVAKLPMPHEILWAVGGYALPMSLEHFVRRRLENLNCRLTVLQSYGVAEVGHTCFASMQRAKDGSPLYRQVAPNVSATIEEDNQRLRLSNKDGVSILTDDIAERVPPVPRPPATIPDRGNDNLAIGEDGTDDGAHHPAALPGANVWRLRPGVSRLHPAVWQDLESWTDQQWQRRSGYLSFDGQSTHYQLRPGVHRSANPCELDAYDYWRCHGGSWTTKPDLAAGH